MNVNTRLLISSLRRNYRTAIGYVLLLLIGYGAIVETVHSHGHGWPKRTDVAAISNYEGSQSSSSGYSRQSECSMCQLQRQLFDGFVESTLFARTAVIEIAFVSTPAVSYFSTLTTPQFGRAPPLV